MNSIKKSYLVLILLASALTHISSQENEKTFIQTLPNGLTLYVIHDSSQALVHTEFVVKAGSRQQDIDNAGFFKLYNQLFFTSDKDAYRAFKDYADVTYSFDTDLSRYTSDLPVTQLEEYIYFLSRCLIEPDFADSDIEKGCRILKEQTLKYSETTTGFINTAIDSIVFSESPWKSESGMYPNLIESLTPQSSRTILYDIGKRYYTPDNSALFVSGPVDSTYIYSLCCKYLSLWHGYYKGQPYDYQKTLYSKDTESTRYVLTSPYFTKEMTQLIVEFTDQSTSITDIISAAFNSYSSSYKDAVLEDKNLGIMSKNYISCSSIYHSGSSRLILQALMDNTYMSPAQQTELFVSRIKNTSLIDDKLLTSAKNSITAKYMEQKGSANEYIKVLSSIWATDSSMISKDPSVILDGMIEKVKDENTESIYKSIQSEEPFIFILVNSSIYDKYDSDFKSMGYAHITKENGSWYLDQVKLTKALDEASYKKNEILQKEDTEYSLEEFYTSNIDTFESYTLNNNIKVDFKYNKSTSPLCVLLKIDRGLGQLTQDNKGLNTILINYFAFNIQTQLSLLKSSNVLMSDIKIESWADNCSSYIALRCTKDDLIKVLDASVNAIIFGETTSIRSDRLVYEQKEQWSQQQSSLINQLKNHAMQKLYKDTPYQLLYDDTIPYLKNISYSDIEESYAEFLDASLYSIIITGDYKDLDIKRYLENSFGLLKEQTVRKDKKIIDPVFKEKTNSIKLHHTFTTDKDSSEASIESPILVPTKDFSDPVLYAFTSPSEEDKRTMYNALLFTLSSMIQDNMDDKGIDCTIGTEKSTQDIPVGLIYTDKVEHTNDFLSCYKKAIQEAEKLLKDNSIDFTNRIKSTWIKKELLKTQTNKGTAVLMSQGRYAYQYLEDYNLICNSSGKDYLDILKKYFTNVPAFQVFSADSKK